MKDMENIEEFLNCYLDGELDDRKANEAKRLIDNDSRAAALYESIRKCKLLMQSASPAVEPEGMYENILQRLERQTLLNGSGVDCHRAGRRNLIFRRLAAAAAILILAAVLFSIVFDVFVPKSSRDRLLSVYSSKQPFRQVLYEKPFPDQPQEDIAVDSGFSVPLIASLTAESPNLVEADWLIAKSLEFCGLFNQTVSIDRSPDRIKYTINCSRTSAVSLMEELRPLWSGSRAVKLDITSRQAGQYITIDDITYEQAVEICSAPSAGARIKMAGDFAATNKILSAGIIKGLPFSGGSDYGDLLLTKPVLTSAEKHSEPNCLQADGDAAVLTILVKSASALEN